MTISPAEQSKIIAALKSRGVTLPCPRCGNSRFTVIDGYAAISLSNGDFSSLIIGGPSVPVAVTACENCGFIAQHALGALGLLPGVEQGKTK